IDSVALDPSGHFRLTVDNAPSDPSLYTISNNWHSIPILASRGESITISSVGNLTKNYTVNGSGESELLRSFYQPFIEGMQRLDSIAIEYAKENISEEFRSSLSKEYNTEYQRIKRQQLSFIIENKSSIAAIYAIFQHLPGDRQLFCGDSDVIYLRTVAEEVSKQYPKSALLKRLEAQIKTMEATIALKENINSSNFPNLSMPDMFGNNVELSSLIGSVVLLDFWSAELGNSNSTNAELKEIYQEYSSKGFNIFQVGIDTSKDRWINAVQDQRLPWISVSDLRGASSPAIGLYNISKLPANFLINKEGEIVARDVWGEELKLIVKKLTK
ncbi:MAG: TlpA disulfide reductase family protein, partial [Rikenellaceae bacterium]